MADDSNTLLKRLPSVDSLLQNSAVQELLNSHSRNLVVEGIREYVESIRRRILKGDESVATGHDIGVADLIVFLEESLRPSLRRAVNGTGIVLHTGLGRAPFAETARKALAEAVNQYATLQVDLQTGKRGDRHAHVEGLLQKLTGAEAALVVNNNAAATLLVLNTLAEGREVIVSRGELVEIGGSFRIPDVMKRSGARLVEVGTTNRTHLKDYESAVTSETGLILRVHQSNYRIVGFTKQVPLEELAALAHSKGFPLVDDLGSGALVDLSRWGLPKEPMVQDSVRAGSDAVCFSGDKLIGGPQCGIIIGKQEYISRMKKNPLTRALRVDKMTYAVLEATLRLFFDEAKLLQFHPVLKMLTEPVESIRKRCLSLNRKLRAIGGENVRIEAVKDFSEVGSGSLAAEFLPTWALSIRAGGISTEELAKRFRLSNPPVIGRIKEDQFLLDCRTMTKDEFDFVENALRQIIQ